VFDELEGALPMGLQAFAFLVGERFEHSATPVDAGPA
jgi:hypothetical protein